MSKTILEKTAKVSGLYIYPIKSCARVEVSSAVVETKGFVGDGRFMVVDENNKFVTARNQPKLVLVQPSYIEGGLTIFAPDVGEIRIELAALKPERQDVSIWRDQVQGMDCGTEVAAFFSDFLKGEYKLVYKDENCIRPHQTGTNVSFADAYPFLIISDASVAELNKRLETPVARL